MLGGIIYIYGSLGARTVISLIYIYIYMIKYIERAIVINGMNDKIKSRRGGRSISCRFIREANIQNIPV